MKKNNFPGYINIMMYKPVLFIYPSALKLFFGDDIEYN